MDTIYSFPVFSTCDSNFYQSQKEIKLGWATAAVLCSRERERESILQCNGLTAAADAATSSSSIGGDCEWVNGGWTEVRWGDRTGRGRTWERRHLVDNDWQKQKGDSTQRTEDESGMYRGRLTRCSDIIFKYLSIMGPFARILLFISSLWRTYFIPWKSGQKSPLLKGRPRRRQEEEDVKVGSRKAF